MEHKGLNAWIGKEVGLQPAKPEQEVPRFRCTLEGVEERGGIEVSFQRREDPEKTHYRFYPWHNVLYVQLFAEEQ
jgi:hypothetical protein